ncbi:hypothetical protein GBA65_01490 [Rubrobacter marinus]|uniref:Tubby C 2 family protein n=1 Tax=Rubrobacter marinus TaxID=2653852 RepID=A0A6G8PSE2_9ACTN|nr:LURP-one-related family protein [Rubrobacter marinus]QIN77399.1 hypothetical protein GBA65_01490 [Rubrobacter marinus]
MARYTMRQRLVSIGEDFDITDEAGRPVYKVDGKVMRLRETFVIEDMRGREVATIREKKLALRESMNILRGGSTIATIRKARFAPFRHKFSIDVAGGVDLTAQGDILHHEYAISRQGDPVARISKHRLTMSDTYSVDVLPGEDDGLVLAVAVAIDEMAHDSDD